MQDWSICELQKSSKRNQKISKQLGPSAKPSLILIFQKHSSFFQTTPLIKCSRSIFNTISYPGRSKEFMIELSGADWLRLWDVRRVTWLKLWARESIRSKAVGSLCRWVVSRMIVDSSWIQIVSRDLRQWHSILSSDYY